MELETVWDGSVRGLNAGQLLVEANEIRYRVPLDHSTDASIYDDLVAAGLDGLTFAEIRSRYAKATTKALYRSLRRLRQVGKVIVKLRGRRGTSVRYVARDLR